jgi:hypothetical protein
MTDTNLKPKKTTKKWIYIGVGLAVFILIAAGIGFWFWNKSKSSKNKSDSTDEKDEEDNQTVDREEWKKADWVDPETGLSNYKFPPLPTNISEAEAKEELLEAIWQWGGKNWDKKKIERTLEKNNKQINLADKKEIYQQDTFYRLELFKTWSEKYQEDIFVNQPDQTKFEKGIDEAESEFLHLIYSLDSRLKLKKNKEIDWLASLKEFTKKKADNKKTKTQKEEELERINNHLEREINPFVIKHVKKFPSLTSLNELNQWVKVLTYQNRAAFNLVLKRWELAKELDKKNEIPSLAENTLGKDECSKNEEFNLIPMFNLYKVRKQDN